MTESELLELFKQKCAECGGIRAWAKKHNLDRSTVQRITQGKHKIGITIPRLLGYKRKPTEYEPIEK